MGKHRKWFWSSGSYDNKWDIFKTLWTPLGISLIELFSLKMRSERYQHSTRTFRRPFFTRGKRACASYYDHMAIRKRKTSPCVP